MYSLRACLFLLIISLPAIALGQSTRFEMVQLADGVYAAIARGRHTGSTRAVWRDGVSPPQEWLVASPLAS